MTIMKTICSGLSDKRFEHHKANAEALAKAFEERVHSLPGYSKTWKAIDTCLSYHGDKNVDTYQVDEFGTVYKFDPNDNSVTLIVNYDD